MLPKDYRIPSFAIKASMSRGRRITGNGITVITTIAQLRAHDKKQKSVLPRFTFIVSTKVAKRAVVRNRLRRILSESIRHVLPSFSQPVDTIIIGSKELVGLTQKDVEARLIDLLKRAGMLPVI